MFRERGLDVGVAEIAAARRRRPRHAVSQLPDQGRPDRGGRRRARSASALEQRSASCSTPTIRARRCSSSSRTSSAASRRPRAVRSRRRPMALEQRRDQRCPRGDARADRSAAGAGAGPGERSAPDVTAIDLLMLVKGMCEAGSPHFAHLEARSSPARQLDLVRASLHRARRRRGRCAAAPPTLG